MKHFTIIVLVCLSFQAYSQITLDKSNALIPLNYEYKHNVNNPLHDVTNIDPTPAGANVTWDFSKINVPIIESATAICVDPAGTPFADSIPNANLCIKNKDSINGPYQYILQGDTKTELLGMGWYETGNTSFMRYESGNTILELPTTYGASYTDKFSYIMYNAGIPFMVDTTTQIIEADAYGTIITPMGTYTDALRIKRTATTQTYMNMGAGWNKTSMTVLTEYQWFKAGIPETVMSVSEFNGDKKYAINYRVGGSNTSFEEQSFDEPIKIFPNPVTTHIDISANTFNIHQYKLLNIHGKVIQAERLNQKKYRMDISALRKGVYILQLESGKKTYTRKILKLGYK